MLELFYILLLIVMQVGCFVWLIFKTAFVTVGLFLTVVSILATALYFRWKKRGVFQVLYNDWADAGARVLQVLMKVVIGCCWLFTALVWCIWLLFAR